MQSTKSLSLEENAAARRFAKDVVDKDFGGNALRASKSLKVSQSYLSEFIGEKRGAGTKLLTHLAKHRGVGLEVVLGRHANTPAPRPPALVSALERRRFSATTRAQLDVLAQHTRAPLTTDDWLGLGETYERTNRSAEELAELRAGAKSASVLASDTAAPLRSVEDHERFERDVADLDAAEEDIREGRRVRRGEPVVPPGRATPAAVVSLDAKSAKHKGDAEHRRSRPKTPSQKGGP